MKKRNRNRQNNDKVSADKLHREIASRKLMHDLPYLINNLPDPDPILQKTGKSIIAYRDLTSDAHVYANIQQRKAGAASMKWQVMKNSAGDNEVHFIRDVLGRLDIDKLINQILDAVFYGYSVLEIMWEVKNGKYIPTYIEEKPQEWFVYDADNKLRLMENYGSEGIVLPKYKFLVAVNQPTYLNPYGEKTLSRCYWPVTFKRSGLQFWVTFTEKYALPFLVAKEPRTYTSDETAALLASLEKMMRDTIAVIPDDSSIEFIDSSHSHSSDVYQKYLEFCNTEISKAILSETLTTEITDRGTYAAAKTHRDILHHLIEGDKRLVEKTVNALIAMIWELNFVDNAHDTIPVFQLYGEDEVHKSLAERDKTLQKMGVVFGKEYYKRYYNLKEDEFEVRET